MNVEAQKPNWHTGGMLPLCARRRNATGSIVWILSAKSLSTFISGEAWKINGLGIDFLTPSFNKHTPLPSICFILLQSVSSHLWSSTCTLAISFLRPSLLFLLPACPLPVSIFHTWYTWLCSVYQNRREGSGKKGAFRSPSATISQDSWRAVIQSLPAGEVDSHIQRYVSVWMPASFAFLEFLFL